MAARYFNRVFVFFMDFERYILPLFFRALSHLAVSFHDKYYFLTENASV